MIFHYIVVHLCLTQVFNSTHIMNKEVFVDLVHNRPKGRGLITLSNHRTKVDDPAVLATFITMKTLVFQTEVIDH